MLIPCPGGVDATACAQSLLAQQGGHDVEILVIGDEHHAETAAQTGLAAARHPFVLRIAAGVLAAPSLLSRLHAALLREDRIALAAPVTDHGPEPARIDVGDRGRTAAGRAEIDLELGRTSSGRVQDVDLLPATCLLGRRASWDLLTGAGAGFDDDLATDDLCLRARIHGHRLVLARDAFVHRAASTAPATFDAEAAATRERARAQFAARWRDDPVGRAVLRLRAGDLEGAARAAAAAQRLQPCWPDADLLLARYSIESRRPAAARPGLEAFLRQCPDHTEALILLFGCWLDLGGAEVARGLWQGARGRCHFEPAQAAALLRRLGEHALAAGDSAAAAADFAQAAELQPEDAMLQNLLGVALLEQRRFGPAIAALERAAALGLALAHSNLGRCHFQAGDRDRALAHFARAAELLPGDAGAQRDQAQPR